MTAPNPPRLSPQGTKGHKLRRETVNFGYSLFECECGFSLGVWNKATARVLVAPEHARHLAALPPAGREGK
jgi:hypothetical protein